MSDMTVTTYGVAADLTHEEADRIQLRARLDEAMGLFAREWDLTGIVTHIPTPPPPMSFARTWIVMHGCYERQAARRWLRDLIREWESEVGIDRPAVRRQRLLERQDPGHPDFIGRRP